MNWVDVLVVLLAVQGAISGARQGLVTALFSFLGVLTGAVLGLRLTPVLLQTVEDPLAKLAWGIAVIVLLAFLGEGLGLWAGRALRGGIAVVRLTRIDNALGAVLQGVAVFVVAWLVALPLTSAAAWPGLASAITRSHVLSTVNSLMPPEARKLPGDLRTMLGESGFTQALEPFAKTPAADTPPPDTALEANPVIAQARSSVLKIRGRAPSCSRAMEGTSFVIAPQRVMTNAHVVAGTSQVAIETGSGQLNAEVVLFDPKTDVAVLSVPGLKADVLNMSHTAAHSGDDVVALGYPLDGPFTASAGRVRERIDLRGPDIYNADTVSRGVYTVRGQVRSGNSGGPLVDTQGQVAGVVFGAAADDPETGFALTADEVADEVASAPKLTTPVSTGPCAE